MIKTIAGRQRGVSLSGLLVWSVLLILAAIGGMKVIPAYVQDAEIRSILSTIANDPEMQGVQSKDIRESFSKRAMMNNINVVAANDIEIVKDTRGLSLSISYQVKIPLVGNASLLLEFNPSSFKK
ncbi:MAG: DUF4845 domain-containing protein [Candidatus Nitrotoga sp.]|nr:DUF4845 domain-containing protein [Candidatus Nitrotoga sp.]MDO9446704.1 DUF4845 domain-containing protein [Candidatus Nitrotoga sp.]MDP1637851.1 DUF4845 domain-containing protein [Candidatus Nitrotoga sp.]MDP1855035.1 DUF4845 domain-containing protein [Candidatus Nitrotoga sp.]MDP3497140.1 DUF4845 domain-containing protein [Candidatus Nitrotoga sp.]